MELSLHTDMVSTSRLYKKSSSLSNGSHIHLMSTWSGVKLNASSKLNNDLDLVFSMGTGFVSEDILADLGRSCRSTADVGTRAIFIGLVWINGKSAESKENNPPMGFLVWSFGWRIVCCAEVVGWRVTGALLWVCFCALPVRRPNKSKRRHLARWYHQAVIGWKRTSCNREKQLFIQNRNCIMCHPVMVLQIYESA